MSSETPTAWPFGHDLESKRSPYERIRDAILNGVMEPGAPLVESQVAAWCGVSRTPVREALTRLEQDGLVERSERGLIVRERSPEEILDIYGVRVVLEETAAREASERHTAFDRVRLERAARAAVEADPKDGSELAVRNRALHRSVWTAGHNEALIDLLERLNMHLMRYPATTLSYGDRWAEALEEHAELLEAIFERNADRAAEVARTHFVKARDIRLKLWTEESG